MTSIVDTAALAIAELRDNLRGKSSKIVEVWSEDLRRVLDEVERRRADDALVDELVGALRKITDHFADVMGGPLITGQGIKFQHGVEGIPTIKVARALLAKVEENGHAKG